MTRLPTPNITPLAAVSREAPVLLAGPTASGKSALAMELAARDGRIVVNADSLQVYDCWRILSARPSGADEAIVPHALYGHIGRHHSYSVGEWLREVTPYLSRPVVIVGGTGLYFSALTEGLADIPAIPAQVRSVADARMAQEGMAAMLADLDEDTKTRIDVLNPARVQRAWEVLHATGRGIASWQRQTGPALLPLSDCEPLVLRPDPTWLDPRIRSRFIVMMEMGALDEARAALAQWDPTLPSSKAIGAPELISHLRGELTLTEAVENAVLASRQYAKRQRTWFRSRMKNWREWSVS
jgi:tRNA dimethylallyltransferase